VNTDEVAKVEELCRRYLAAMESSELQAVVANFADDATATSPISGKQPARDFYTTILQITSGRSMELRTIFVGASDPSRAAVHVAYTRTVQDGRPATRSSPRSAG
jgi:ketosteroid isomerase-like protein